MQVTATTLVEEGTPRTITGQLEVIDVPAWEIYPAFKAYFVNGLEIDHTTIKEIKSVPNLATRNNIFFTDYLRDKAKEAFANDCHEENTGRFCEKHGTSHGTEGGGARVKTDPADIRKWAKDNGYEISDRGRLSSEIIAAHKKANRAKPQPKPSPTPAKTEGDLDDKLWDAGQTLSSELSSLPANLDYQGDPYRNVRGEPGEKLVELEQRTRKVGEVIHNEITNRLVKSGIKEPVQADMKKLHEDFDKAQAELKKHDIPYEESSRIRDEVWGKHISHSDPENVKKLQDAMEAAYPGHRERREAARVKVREANEAILSENKLQQEYAVAYRATALTVLGEARGGAYGNLDFENVKATNLGVREALKTAGQVYPDEWVVQSDRAGTITGKKASRGLHNGLHDGEGNFHSTISVDAQPGPSAISTNGFYPVAVHEIGHRFEELRPHIRAMEWAFWNRRTQGEPTQRLQKLDPGKGYKTDEHARSDKFIDPYIGKVYGEGASRPWESFQMGVQYLFGGAAPIIRDKDYAHFILGLLARG